MHYHYFAECSDICVTVFQNAQENIVYVLCYFSGNSTLCMPAPPKRDGTQCRDR